MPVKTERKTLVERLGRKKVRGLKYLLIAVPFLLYVFAMNYVPLFGWIYSVFDYKMGQQFLDFSNMKFIGLDNFRKLFAEHSEVLRVLRNTLVMSALTLLATPFPVLFAIMINEIKGKYFKKFVQTATTLPNFISWIIVYGIAFSFFSMNGFINMLLKNFGIDISGAGIMGDPDKVWLFQWFLNIWKTLGWSSIIYIAAIVGIDGELFDAARVDGANKLKTIWHITIPGIMPTYVVMFLLGVSNILSNGFDQYFMFYNSVVADKIEVLDYYVYKVGFLINDYPYSITLGMLKSLISILLLFVANTLSKKVRGNPLYKECEKAMGKKKIRVSLSERILQIVIYIVVTIFVILCVYPFYYLIIYSLSDPTLAAKGIYLLPKGFTFSIYQRIFEKTNFGHAFLISASRTVINTGLCILGSSLFAYLVTKEDMIGRKFVYRFVVITMYIGAGLIPYYITMKAYHLKDTYFLYIIPGIINAFYVILIKTFIEQIPPSLEESAEMDGAGFLRTYASIIMPLSKPIIATVAVYAAVGAWNSWQDNYLLVQNPKLQTVQLILYNCINDAQRIADSMKNGQSWLPAQ